jgi:predicted GTPase
MTLQEVEKVIQEVYPKIEAHYGHSKFTPECTPYVETHYNIYARYSGEEEAQGEEDGCHAEYDRMDNSIVIYWPNMKSRKHVIETLVHEYQHYLQSPSWMKRYYDMGYRYDNHPYEVAAYKEENNWEIFS